MSKTLFALPFLAFTLIAAKDPPPPPPKPPVSLNAPAEVAADPANRWTLELSNGGKVERTGLPLALAQPRNPQIIRVQRPVPP